MSFLHETLANEFKADAHSKVLGNGTQLEFLDTGILRIKPNAVSAKHRVIISCGIHGNETAPIEMVEQLFQEIVAAIVRRQIRLNDSLTKILIDCFQPSICILHHLKRGEPAQLSKSLILFLMKAMKHVCTTICTRLFAALNLNVLLCIPFCMNALGLNPKSHF